MREITLDPKLLRKLILETTDGFVKDDLARLLANGGARLIQWLRDEGIRFMRASASEYHKWVLAPPGRSRPGLDWEGRGGDVLLRTLEAQLVKRGGMLVRGAKAQLLISENGRCAGSGYCRRRLSVQSRDARKIHFKTTRPHEAAQRRHCLR